MGGTSGISVASLLLFILISWAQDVAIGGWGMDLTPRCPKVSANCILQLLRLQSAMRRFHVHKRSCCDTALPSDSVSLSSMCFGRIRYPAVRVVVCHKGAASTGS